MSCSGSARYSNARPLSSFGSSDDLAGAMQRAAVAHGEHEKRLGAGRCELAAWYAAYMMAEQVWTELPT